MPRLSLQQTNFTAGEISPRVRGRTDLDRYNNAARVLLNAHPLVHGGAKRRAGTKFLLATKFSGGTRARLIPFVFSRDVAYMLEFGHLYVRVWPAGGGAMAAEVASPYSESELPDIDYAQGADTMFLAHPAFPIHRLRRFSVSSFDLAQAPFSTTPFDEQGVEPTATLTLSSATVGTGRTATASAASFLPSDVGRQLTRGPGAALVTAYVSATQATVDISAAFASTTHPAGAWRMDVSPQAILKPSAKDPVASSIELTGSVTRAASIFLSAKTGAITVTSLVPLFAAGDVGLSIFADSGVADITAFTSATEVTATTSSDFLSTSYASGGYGITAGTWRADDVGKFVRVNGGLCKITAIPSASKATATILTALTSTVAAPPLSWSLESSVWSAANGYPRTITLHEQRLVAAGTDRYPQTIWGSRIGEYLDFTKGTADDDSYSFTIAADEVHPIAYLVSMRNLAVHTYGGEFSLQGGVEKPITPTNVRIRPESSHGSKGVRPVTIGKESVFVQRAGRKVRAMSYRYEFDGYTSPDITVLAEHITAGGVVDMAYQQEPDMLVWAVRADGALLSCTLDREQSVTGWSRHFTRGHVESVASIPSGDTDEVWLIVRRTAGGQSVRYLEMLDDALQPMLPGAPYDGLPPSPEPRVYGFTVDSGQVFDAVGGQSQFLVPHLAGLEVDIVADGAVQPRQTVGPLGEVATTRPSYRTLIGLPFRTEIGLLTPEVGTGTGTAQGNSMRTGEITMRFLNTVGARVLDGEGSDQVVPFRQFGTAVLDRAPELFSGDVRISVLGWDRGRSELSIVQEQPLPMHLLAVVRKFTVND